MIIYMCACVYIVLVYNTYILICYLSMTYQFCKDVIVS